MSDEVKQQQEGGKVKEDLSRMEGAFGARMIGRMKNMVRDGNFDWRECCGES